MKLVQEHGYDARYDDLVKYIEQSQKLGCRDWDMAHIFKSNAGFFANYILEHCVGDDGDLRVHAQPCIEVMRHDTQVTCGYGSKFRGNYSVRTFNGRTNISDYFICLEYLSLVLEPVKPYKRLEWLHVKESCLLCVPKSLLTKCQDPVGYEWF